MYTVLMLFTLYSTVFTANIMFIVKNYIVQTIHVAFYCESCYNNYIRLSGKSVRFFLLEDFTEFFGMNMCNK